MADKEQYLQNLQRDEELHSKVYKQLESGERGEIKRTLLKLYTIEHGHSEILKKLLRMNKYAIKERDDFLRILLIRLSRKLFGIAFTIKFMEYNKLITNSKLTAAIRKFSFSSQELALLKTMEKGEKAEDILSATLLKLNPVLSNVRDVIFGMNDGLVEVLAATVGFGAALRLPVLVLIAGLLVALSGTLSMSGGAYLSTKYEHSIALPGNAKRTPARSALYTGAFYFFGAVFPILPFALGMSGAIGIALSILFTMVVLSIVSSAIAVLSGQSIAKRVAESLLISLGAASATILLGFYARYALHIVV
ncbi:MAG: VIT1/CCC1 transporter family protein [Candidatus Micrarchaeaceae archaeon]